MDVGLDHREAESRGGPRSRLGSKGQRVQEGSRKQCKAWEGRRYPSLKARRYLERASSPPKNVRLDECSTMAGACDYARRGETFSRKPFRLASQSYRRPLQLDWRRQCARSRRIFSLCASFRRHYSYTNVAWVSRHQAGGDRGLTHSGTNVGSQPYGLVHPPAQVAGDAGGEGSQGGLRRHCEVHGASQVHGNHSGIDRVGFDCPGVW